MNKPSDPRKHGLVKPEKIIRLTITKLLREARLDSGSLDLLECWEQWEKAKQEAIDDGWTIVENPTISKWDHKLCFHLEKVNPNYFLEMAAYNAKIAEYDLLLQQWEENLRSNKEKIENESIDQKIERLKARLEKLNAIKNGELGDYTKI